MVYRSLCREARSVSSASLAVAPSRAVWEASLDARREQWREMLGLSPLPERTPLNATITGTLDRGDYVVEKLHFQSVPGAYVIGNLYRPPQPTAPLPAILYLCGHTQGKVYPAYQANPRWFGQHGYAALVLDPIQLGESQGFHHGTYNLGMWDWYSRGYTPAGVEVWNAIRALDYLASRDDVDPDRMGVTGLSGGGAISWFHGAADERVKVVVPVCQTGSIEHCVVDRATDGHCDCAFWINTYRWCTPDIGALIAPRALMIASGTEDVLWRPYAFREDYHRLHHLYSRLGVPENVALVEDLTPHGYTPRLRQAIFQWFSLHLKGDAAPVTDDVTDFVEPAENLSVFGGQLPANDKMKEIWRGFVPAAPCEEPGDAAAWQERHGDQLQRLRDIAFRRLETLPEATLREVRTDGEKGGEDSLRFDTYVFDTDDGLTLALKTAVPVRADGPLPVVACAAQPEARATFCGGGASRPGVRPQVATAVVEVRNTGATSLGPGLLWTARRAYPLVGSTLPERQVHDLLSALSLLRGLPFCGPTVLYGKGYTAPLALYAALLDPSVTELILEAPPESHESPDVPEFLGVLRAGDLPQNLALMYPRPITFVGEMPAAYGWTQRLYERLGSADRFSVLDSLAAWGR